MPPSAARSVSVSSRPRRRNDLELGRARDFLLDRGLRIDRGEASGGFVTGVAIRAGTLIYDSRATVSNLLHEAGHLAICPGRYRTWLDGSRDGSLEVAFERILAHARPAMDNPDAPLARALIQMSDPEATAWAFAAGMAIGLAAHRVIEDCDYQGEGADIRFALQARAYMGIHGLHHAGMTRLRGEDRYPAMQRWLQIE